MRRPPVSETEGGCGKKWSQSRSQPAKIMPAPFSISISKATAQNERDFTDMCRHQRVYHQYHMCSQRWKVTSELGLVNHTSQGKADKRSTRPDSMVEEREVGFKWRFQLCRCSCALAVSAKTYLGLIWKTFDSFLMGRYNDLFKLSLGFWAEAEEEMPDWEDVWFVVW